MQQRQSGLLNKLVYEVVNGGSGVSIFFVLSGFLITYLLLTERIIYGKIHVWHFYLRRILRIWPLYFAVILFAFVVYPSLKSFIGINSNLASQPVYYFTFLSNFDVINILKLHTGSDALMENITWSVAIEEQFYLVWPLLFLVVPKRYYIAIFLSIICICLLFRFNNSEDQVLLYFHSLSVCADLAVGGLCAYISIFSTKFTDFFSRISTRSILYIYLLGFSWMLYGSNLLNPYVTPLFYRLVTTFFFAFIILEQNFSHHSFYKFSRNRTFTFWGKYTYGLYLLHPIALLILDVIFRALNISYKESFLPLFSLGIAGLFLTLSMSYLSYEYVEKRFLFLKEKFSFVRKQTKVLGHTDAPLQKQEAIRHDQVA